MKKLFALFFVLALTVSVMGLGYAATDDPDTENAFSLDRYRGASGITPPTVIVKVRYGHGSADAAGLSSGDVVVWDTNSADGYTISACLYSDANAVSYAGVLVTDIQTATDTIVRGNGRNIGYMAIQGYCLAKVDTSSAATNNKLTPNGATLTKSFSTYGPDNAAVFGALANSVSHDIGILLKDTGSDTLMPVWLK